MTLFQFLRQWERRRLVVGVGVSVLFHALLVLALIGVKPHRVLATKRGDALFVDLTKPDEPAPAGLPGAPSPEPGRPSPSSHPLPPPAPPRPAVAARPPSPPPSRSRPAPAPRREAPPTRVASAPTPPAPPSPPPARTSEEAAPSTPAPASTPAAPAATPPTPAPAAAGSTGQQVAMAPSQPASAGRPSAPDIRALGHGQGGRGGRTNGRGGIEGEPIPLDTRDPRYNDYFDRVRRRIKSNWGFPCVKNEATQVCEHKTTQLVIEFGIAKQGDVPFVTVVRSSGYAIYDEYAVNAIKLSSPFPPVPDSISKKGVAINATFSYVVEASLTNLLR